MHINPPFRIAASLLVFAGMFLAGLNPAHAAFSWRNTPPTISGSPSTVANVGVVYSFKPTARDVDGDRLTFSIQGRPAWASFDSTTGALYGTPAASDVGTYPSIVISVTDGRRASRKSSAWVSLPAYSITVRAAATADPTPIINGPPVISGTPASSVTAGQPYSFQPTASDPDGQALTYSITNRPTWATFSTTTGSLSGTPTSSNVGSFGNVVISVSDGSASAALPAFAITVAAAPNNPPTISGTPPTSVTAGQPYSFRPTASDPDGQALTYSIINRPTWATFSTTTGSLSGTPTSSNVGSFGSVVISVSDGSASAALPAFAITVVAAPNNPPTISGTPPTSVTAGQPYAFTPSASDPDAGQTLRFGIANQPSWASFDAATGRLAGTPAAGTTASSSNIVISVSDGTASATLAPFRITVTAANRAPTINGTPPSSVTVGQAYSFRPTASDPDGQALSFSITNKPSWMSFNSATGALTGTPGSGQVATYSGIIISASDGASSASLPAFSVTVADVQTGAATLSWTPPTLNEDGTPITNLKGYRVYYGTNSANLGTTLDIPNAGIATAVIENLSPATWYFAVKAYNTSNVESSLSNLASKTIL